jgi:hypothetical protein
VIAKIEDMQEETIFRIYLTDALKIIGENTAKFAGGSMISKRFCDIICNQKTEPEKPVEQIIDEVIKNCGLEVV